LFFTFPEEYIKDAGLDTNPDYPVSRARGITATKTETRIDEDDTDIIEINTDSVIEELGMDTDVEDDDVGFRTREQIQQGKDHMFQNL
jgi:hypothetical protein